MVVVIENLRKAVRYRLHGLVVAVLSLALVAAFDVPQASAQVGLFFHMLRMLPHHGGRYSRSRHGRWHERHYASPHHAVRTGARRGKPAGPEPVGMKVAPPTIASPSNPAPPVAAPSGPDPRPANTPPLPTPGVVSSSGSGASPVTQPSPTAIAPSPAPAAQLPRTGPAPDEVKPKDD